MGAARGKAAYTGRLSWQSFSVTGFQRRRAASWVTLRLTIRTMQAAMVCEGLLTEALFRAQLFHSSSQSQENLLHPR